MTRQRTKDRWAGAAIAVLVMLVLVVAAVVTFLWWTSEPAGAADDAAVSTPQPSTEAVDSDGSPTPAQPPADLAAGETWLGDLVLDAATVVTPESVLRDVQAVGQDVRAGPDGVVAGSLAVDATVPFEEVAAQLGEGNTVRAAEQEQQASVVRTVELAGRELEVVATGTVEVESGLLVVEPTSIDVGGPAFLSRAIAAAARELVTIEQEIEGVPEGLVLQEVTVQDDGFRARLTGEDVQLAAVDGS